MGMIVCKSCYETQFRNWVQPFNQNANEPAIIPEFNENAQHYTVYTVAEIASKLKNGEMLEIICTVCKRTHVGKDENGNIKVRFAGDPIGEWRDHV